MRAHGIILMPENMVHNYWGEVLINDQKNPFLFSAGKSASKFDLIISNKGFSYKKAVVKKKKQERTRKLVLRTTKNENNLAKYDR
jgi:hypothetical protein